MTLSELTASVLTGTTPLHPTTLSLLLDEARAPFAEARMVLPYVPALADVLDPRNDPRVTIGLEHRFSGSVPLSVLSAEFAGDTLAAMSAAFTGQRLASLTARYGYAWNAFGFRPAATRSADLGVRERTIDHRAGTITVVAASDEALLVDYGLLSTTPLTPGSLTVRAAVELALSKAIPSAVLVTADGAQTITAESAVWQPGVSAWKYLEPITASANLRLWCDELRVWHLAAPEKITTPGQATLAATGSVTSAQDTVDRDEEWYDGVVVTYVWTDSGGVKHTAYDIAGDATSSKIMNVTYDRPFTRPGEAAARLRKTQGMGHVLAVDAVTDLGVYPAQPASLSVPDTPTQTGYVAAVRWSLPEGTMSVRTRALVDTPSTSWAFGPVGYSWNEVPAGQSWPAFVWPAGG